MRVKESREPGSRTISSLSHTLTEASGCAWRYGPVESNAVAVVHSNMSALMLVLEQSSSHLNQEILLFPSILYEDSAARFVARGPGPRARVNCRGTDQYHAIGPLKGNITNKLSLTGPPTVAATFVQAAFHPILHACRYDAL